MKFHLLTAQNTNLRRALRPGDQSFDHIYTSLINSQENRTVPGHWKVRGQDSKLGRISVVIMLKDASKPQTSFAIASERLGISELASIRASLL